MDRISPSPAHRSVPCQRVAWLSRRLPRCLAWIGLVLFPWLATWAVAGERPNILVILADDLGYGDVSTYHSSDVLTPNLDRLAAGGMRFDCMRANATVCSPSRAALLTGRYPDRVGVPGVIRTDPRDSWGYLLPSIPTLADRLRQAGYHTALVGKWHLGLESPNIPNDRGFDYFHGFLGDMMDSYTTHRRHGLNYMRRDRDEIDPAGHATDLFTEWSTAYLRERAADKKPFFLYLAYNAPHFPIEPPAEWLDRVKRRLPRMPAPRAANIALVEHLDDALGRVMRVLEETGLERDTLVVFGSDNGGSLPHAQSNDPWRGGKQSHYDGGLRIPFVVRWPGQVVAGSRSEYPGLLFDVFPTALEVAGVAIPPDLDAVSLVPALKGQAMATSRALYFLRREGGPEYGGKSYEAYIQDGWKLLQNSPVEPWELYDIRNDPFEEYNLAASNPKKLRELLAPLQLHVQHGGRVPWQKPQ